MGVRAYRTTASAHGWRAFEGGGGLYRIGVRRRGELSEKEFLSNRKLRRGHTFAKAVHSVQLVSLAYTVPRIRTIVMCGRQQPIEVRGRFNARQTAGLHHHRELIQAFQAHGSHPFIKE